MQPAPEFEPVVLRFYVSFTPGNGDLAEQLTSHEAGVSVVPGDIRVFRQGPMRCSA